MNFDLDDDQRDLAAAARDFLAGAASPDRARKVLDGAPAEEVGPGRDGLGEQRVRRHHGSRGRGWRGRHAARPRRGRRAGRPRAGRPVARVLRPGRRPAGRPAGSPRRARRRRPPGGRRRRPPGRRWTPSAPTPSSSCAGRTSSWRAGRRVTAGEPIDPTRGLAPVDLAAGEVLLPGARDRWDRARQVARVVLAAEGLGAAGRRRRARASRTRRNGPPSAARSAPTRPSSTRWSTPTSRVEQLRSLVWWAAWAADDAPGRAAAGLGRREGGRRGRPWSRPPRP